MKKTLKELCAEFRVELEESGYDLENITPEDAVAIRALAAAYAGVAEELPQYRCTVCGRFGTVGRCCGLETREAINAAARAEQEALDE